MSTVIVLSVFVINRSVVGAATVVVAVAVLLPVFVSPVAVTVAELLMTVLTGVAALTLTTSVKVAVPAGASVAVVFVVVTVPVPPTVGVLDVQPVGADNETNVVLAGITSESVMLLAAAAPVPLLVSVIVYVMFWPAVTGSGVSTLVTPTSMVGAAA